jgi:REase_DpnII-MboI
MDEKTREQLTDYLAATDALLVSMNTSVAADSESVWKYAGFGMYARKYNQFVQAIAKLVEIEIVVDLYDMDRLPSINATIAPQQKEIFEGVHANLSILKAFLESKLGVRTDKIRSLTDFFQSNLRRAIFDEPEKEIEVQNVVEQLLIGRGLVKGIDYDREVGRVKVSIKETIPDFILQKLGLAIEVKLAKTVTKSKEIVDEINADIRAYGKEYASMLFIVYDLGTIRDEVEFKQDLEVTDHVTVIVVKH